MNKEYMKITPETIMVSNERGQLEERDIEYSNIDKALVLENNLEYLNRIIVELEHYVSIDHPFDKEKYYTNLEAPLMATFACATVGTLYSKEDGFIIAAGAGVAFCGLSMLYTGICNIDHLKDVKRKKEAYKEVLMKAYYIRANIVERLNSLRGNVDINDKEINIPISILEDKQFMYQVEEELNDVYLDNVSSRKLKKELPIK